ncbi:MAG: AbrB/MazE/SpoVT family DNA-binding domain-containing protein [Desulfurococcales archaeon]|nr:AbrB/MazE/SpoVT family DNA-binding domain-containing protein [Desulfurococcales archaeon]
MRTATRKLLRLGSRSVVVTLPKEWIDANSLKPGDRVYVVEEGDRVVIMPYTKRESKHAEMIVDLNKLGVTGEDPIATARRVLGCAYIMGVDTVLIKAEKKLLNSIASEAANLGFPIIAVNVDEASETLKISNIIDFSRLEPRHSIKTFARIVDSVVEVISSLAKGTMTRSEALAVLSRIKLETMELERMLIRALLEPRIIDEGKQVYSMLLSASLLTLMVDGLISDARLLVERGLKVSESALIQANALSSLTSDVVLLLANPSLSRIKEVSSRLLSSLEKAQEARIGSASKGDTVILASVVNSYRILVILLHTSYCLALSSRHS